MPFARAVTDMIEKMKKSAKGCPQLPPDLPPALYTLTELEWYESDVWQFAGLDNLYKYLRKHSGLKIHQDWKAHFPRKL